MTAPLLEPGTRLDTGAGEGRWYHVGARWWTPDGGGTCNRLLGRFENEQQAIDELIEIVGRYDEPDDASATPVGEFADTIIRFLVDLEGGAFLPEIEPRRVDWDRLRAWRAQMDDAFLDARTPLTREERRLLDHWQPIEEVVA